MKKTSSLSLLAVIITVLVTSLFQVQASDNVDWERFSQNLVKALKSDNTGIQRSAMQLVIKYRDQLDVDEAVFEVLHEFRNNKNQKVRQLALATLAAMNHGRANSFLSRQIKFEDNPAILRQLIALEQNRLTTR